MECGDAEDQDKPRRNLNGLWLLPVLALGIGTLLATRKPPPPEPSKSLLPPMTKDEAYDKAKQQMMLWSMESNPRLVSRMNYAPYTQDAVTDLGQSRFRCSSYLLGRSPTGVALQRRWQCTVLQYHGYWMCVDSRQMPWEQVSPGPKKRGTDSGGNAQR